MNLKVSETALTRTLDKSSAFFAALIPAGIIAGLAVMEILIGLSCFFWIIRSFTTRFVSLKRVLKNPIIIGWFLWILSIYISVLFNETDGMGAAHDFVYIRFLLLVCAIVDISFRLPIHKYLIFGLGFSIIFGFLNFLSAYMVGCDFMGNSVSHYVGTKHYEIGRIMIIAPFAAAFFGAWGLFKRGALDKGLIWIICIIAVILLFFSKGRTGMISVAVSFYASILFYFYQKNKKLPRSVVLITIAVLVLSISFFIYGYNNFYDKLGSFYHRVWIWKISFALWLERLWFGTGVANYETAFEAMALSGKVASFIAPNGGVFGPNNYPAANHAHNLILMLLTCGGVFGLFSFVTLCISTLINVVKNAKGYRAGLIGWGVAFIITGASGFSIYHSGYTAYFAFFTGLAGCKFSLRG
jgi:O-antigen ligase